MGEEGWEVPCTDPARLGWKGGFDGNSQGAGGSSLQTKGVSAVKLCVERRKKDKKPQTREQNTEDLSGCFFTPAKQTLMAGVCREQWAWGIRACPWSILAHPTADSASCIPM